MSGTTPRRTRTMTGTARAATVGGQGTGIAGLLAASGAARAVSSPPPADEPSAELPAGSSAGLSAGDRPGARAAA